MLFYSMLTKQIELVTIEQPFHLVSGGILYVSLLTWGETIIPTVFSTFLRTLCWLWNDEKHTVQNNTLHLGGQAK